MDSFTWNENKNQVGFKNIAIFDFETTPQLQS